MGNLIDFEFSSLDKNDFIYNKCDTVDRVLAIGCGTVAGLVDSFFVGMPGKSRLGAFTDKMTDNLVISFAKKMGWKPQKKNENNVASAIGSLERKYKINYDERNTTDVGGAFNMSASDHHLKSLGHSPDIIGLFFSVLDQFKGTSSFVSDGEIIVIESSNGFELHGKSFISKLFCAIVNWLGHLMSDVAGSSGRRGHANNNRGSGLSAPFYNMFQLCDFGNIKGNNGSSYTIADFSTKLYRDGYDARFYATAKIPVILCNLLIKLCWFIKKNFCEKFETKDCIKSAIFTSFSPESLRVMLLWGHGTLCVVDAADAAIRSKYSWEGFFLHINLPAWYKLFRLVFREMCIKLRINSTQMAIDVIADFNKEINDYLNHLKTIDVDRWLEETNQINNISNKIELAKNDDELTEILLLSVKELGADIPWGEDRTFEEAMADENWVLEIK